MSAGALATCEVQVSAADSQTVPIVASNERWRYKGGDYV